MAANKRLPASARAALTKQSGLLLSHPSDVLLLGSDHSGAAGSAARFTDQHSDSIMLLRVDPGHHRLVYLSIPRDLQTSIAGHGDQKINAAMQFGGPALAIKTISAFTGLPVNHVALVDFSNFVSLISAIGGVDINVPEPILSDKFDCPYPAARCARWTGWRFAKGMQHMNAKQALIYSRIRVNQLNPADTDISRGVHQQQVMQAVLSKLASINTFFGLPFDGGSLLKPLTTDLSTAEFIQLAWIKFRASSILHCRLGGKPVGGYLLASPDNSTVISETLGTTPPKPPRVGAGPFAPGCVTGTQQFKN